MLIQGLKAAVPWSIALYVASYLISALLYPGGHSWSNASVRFSWRYNYGCDLFSCRTPSGLYNPGYLIARIGLFGFLFGVGFFFLSVTTSKTNVNIYLQLIQGSAVLSMLAATCIFSRWHNLSLMVSFPLLLISVTGLMCIFWLENQRILIYQLIPAVVMGCICFVLWLTKIKLEWVPLTQKVAMAFFLYWVFYAHFLR